MLSIIIPTLNEAKIIGATISQIQKQKGDFEIIVVDGNSGDPTRKIVESLGVKLIKSERGLASQYRAALLEAKGDIILFLHADSKLPPDGVETLNKLEASEVEAGAFRQKYDRFNILSIIQATINNINAAIFGIYSGEQGIFIKRSLLKRIRFPDSIVLENKKLCYEIRRSGAKKILLRQSITSSGRRVRKISHFIKLNLANALYDIGVSGYKLKKYFRSIR